MKRIFLISIVVAGGLTMSCTNPKGEKANIAEADTIVANTEGAEKYIIDPTGSTVEWIGYKPTGQHNGTLGIKSGTIYLIENTPVGGEFVMDMQSIKVLDLTDPEWNGKLTGHLRSSDFFDVDNHPEANFVITRIVRNPAGSPAFLLTGNLTIKGITKSITFGADVNSDGTTFTGITPQFKVDRTEFDIRYKSNKFFTDLKDEFINDEFTLTIQLKGTKAM